ncbi:MAG: hypothetical protein L0154_01805 [Chloroflexi bacterium]|nr:hypothetical protein [Chloroflexota bacterium]
MGMTAQDRQKLAEKLAGMSYKKARKEVRRLDDNADLRLWRVSVGDDEWHTTYVLPNLEVKVVLVEKAAFEDQGAKVKVDWFYTEARVDDYS